MIPKRFWVTTVRLAAVIASIAASPPPARAEELVMCDVTFVQSPESFPDGHFRVAVPRTIPANWHTPVRYLGGIIRTHIEVITKPSDAPTVWTICFQGVGAFRSAVGYGCYSSPSYRAPGAIDFTHGVEELSYPYEMIDWTRRLLETQLILKDDMNVKPLPPDVGQARAALFMPTKVRIVVTVVPPAGAAMAPTAGHADAAPPGRDAGARDLGGERPADAVAGADPEPAAPGSEPGEGVPRSGCAVVPGVPPASPAGAVPLEAVFALALRRRWRASAALGLRGLPLLALIPLVSACSGTIGDDRTDPGAGDDRGDPAPSPATSPGSGPLDGTPTSGQRLARLSHIQWANTVRDLLRLPTTPIPASAFITEPARGTFDNNGTVLQVSSDLWLDYQRAAETLAAMVAGDPKLIAASTRPDLPPEGPARARTFIEAFGLRAYRRPLTDAEIAQVLALFNEGPALVASGDAFADGVQMAVTLFLQSPHFLYRTELARTPAVRGRAPLDDYEVAAKLSFSITNSMPDDALSGAAAARQLSDPGAVRDQAGRLLATLAAQRTVEDFHRQLLDMARYDQISKDPRVFPDFAVGMGGYARTETLAFIKDVVLTRDKGLAELLLEPHTFVNGTLARVYGLARPVPPGAGKADPFMRVDLNPSERAGLLTQVGFLASYADEAQPQTILRGAFINRNILCQALPPPPDAFTLPPAAGKTNRQRVEAATGAPACVGCHATLINPPGFALEQYDALGKFRARDGSQAVNASGTYAFDGRVKTFDGGVELSRLVAGSRAAHDCYASHWLEYVLGRLADAPRDKGLAAQLGARSSMGSSVRSLILDIVTSDAFLTRNPAGDPP